jgi:hypothetical protein
MDFKKFEWIYVLLVIFAVLGTLDFITRDIFLDESFSYQMALKPISFIIGGNDVHPPLYYILLKPFALLTSNIVLLRFTSVFCFLLFLTAFYFYAKWKFGSIPASIASLIIITSPTMLYYATELRMYMLLLFLGMMAIICVDDRFIHFNAFLPLAFFLGTMFYTHYMSVLFSLAIITYVCLKYLKIEAYWEYFIIPTTFLFLYISPQIYIFIMKTLPLTTQHWAFKPTLLSLFSSFTYLITPPFSRMWLYFIPFIALIIFMFMNKIKPQFKKNMLYYLLWLLPILTIWLTSQFFPVYHHRYTLYSLIGLLLLVCAYTQSLVQAKSDDWNVALALIVAGAFLSINAMLIEIPSQTMNHSVDFITNSTEYNTLPIIHNTTFSYIPYKMYFQDKEQYLSSNLNLSRLFMFGGSVLTQKDMLNKTICNYLSVSDKPFGEILFNESGLYISKVQNCG